MTTRAWVMALPWALLGLLGPRLSVEAAPGSEGVSPPRAAPVRPDAAKTPPRRLVLRGPAARVPSEAGGEYGGVTPGLPTMPRMVLPRDAATQCYVTWTGFQLLPNGSRVFLQLNRVPSRDLQSAKGEIRVELPACRVHRTANLLPLDLKYFDTPVGSVRVSWKRRMGATLRLGLKSPAQPKLEVVQLQGWTYLFLTFHHVRARPAPPALPRRPAAPLPREAPKGPSPP